MADLAVNDLAQDVVQIAPELRLQEVRIEGGVARMRLVLQDEGAPLEVGHVADRFDPLCAAFAHKLAEQKIENGELVVSISQKALPFGETAPEVVQFFELYDLVAGQCHWRAF